ncbi:MAG: hypothetical protein CMO80_08875 [Verrucomicrobiales bacterium]|nr:hypothetical protein [Verrucomicrobiales bacterium]
MEFLGTINFWMVIGFLLVIGEVFTGSYISLALSVAAFLMAGVILLFPGTFVGWKSVLLTYSLLSLVISIYPIMRLRRGVAVENDINE